MNASDCDILLETQLSSLDPTAPARLFTVLQGLLTPTAQRSPRNVVYLHRGINPSKRLFFQALCAALGRSNSSYRNGCGWVTSENIDDAARILNSGPTGRYPQLLVLDGIATGSLIEWRHLMSLAASPAVQIHILQAVAWPFEPLRLPTALVEQYDWRDLSSAAVSLRADAVDVLAPAIAAWLGIVGGAHPIHARRVASAPPLPRPAVLPIDRQNDRSAGLTPSSSRAHTSWTAKESNVMSESASPAVTAAPTTTKQPRATSLHPAAAVVRDQPLFTVEQFSVAGDADTINGKIFAGTSADDLRQGIPWNARHEAIFAGMLARGNSRLCLHPETRVRARTQTGEPISLYLQALPSGAGTAARDDLTLDGVSYAAVIEGGRQRRRCAEAAGTRLKWIADTFGAPLRSGKVPGRVVKFRNAILGWLASPEGKASDEAAWLTESLVLDLIANPEEEFSGWFTPDLQPLPFLLTASVFGVNVNLSDPELLGRSIGRNEGKVKTPPSMRAAQIGRLRSKLKADGTPLLTFDRIGVLLLGSAGGGDTIRDYSLVSELIPEVLALMDADMLSLKVAVKGNAGRRDQAFVNHPKGGERTVLTPKQQGYVLACLTEEFTDGEGKLKDISGDRAFRVALKAKEQALAGATLTLKQLAELEGDDGKSVEEEQAAAKGKPEKAPQSAQEPTQTAPATTTQPAPPKAAGEPQGAAPQAQRPASGSASQVHVAQTTPVQTVTPATSRPVSGSAALKPPTLTRWSEEQIAAWAQKADELAQTLPDPGVSGLTQSEIDRRSQAQAEAVIGAAVLAHLAGRVGALRDFPVLRQILGDVPGMAASEDAEETVESEAAAPAEAAPTVPAVAEVPQQRRVSAEEFQRALMTTAIDAWVDADHATPIPQIDPKAAIAGILPTPEEVVQAQAALDRLAAAYEATDKGVEMEAYMLDTIYAS